MKCKYFVSYFETTNDYGFGFGNSEIVLNGKIDCFNDIEYLEKELLKRNERTKTVTIINYLLMEEMKKEGEIK